MMFKESEQRGVSPVVGTILLVAITVIIAGSIAAVVYGFSDGQTEAVTANLQFTGVQDYDNKFTIAHDGGDTIQNAFDGGSWSSNVRLTINGEEQTNKVIPSVANDNHFNVGDEVDVELDNKIDPDDTIKFIYVPSDYVLASTTVH